MQIDLNDTQPGPAPEAVMTKATTKKAAKAALRNKPAKRKAAPKPAAKSKKSVKAAKKAKAEVKLRSDGLREGSAGGKLVDAVCSKKGVTHAEACEIVGWKQCRPYLLKVCAAAKVKLRKERQDDGQVRYFGSKPARSKQAATTA